MRVPAGRWPARHAGLARAVRAALSDELRDQRWRGSPNRYAGHCYVASEAFYHLAGGKAAGWIPVRLQHEGASHWWLRDRAGQLVDLTAEQFETPVPYESGRGGGFLTGTPSRRATIVIERVRQGSL